MKIRKLLILFLAVLTLISAIPVMADNGTDNLQVGYTSYEKENLNSFIRKADAYSYSDGVYSFDKTTTNGTESKKEVLSLILLDTTKKTLVDNNINVLRTSTRGTGGHSFSDWDASISIYATVSITYTSSYIGDTQYTVLDSVSVSRTENYNGVAPDNQYVNYGCWGRPYQGSAATQNAYVELSPRDTSWSINTPSSWLPVSMMADHTIGATYTLNLHRGTSSSTWQLRVACYA